MNRLKLFIKGALVLFLGLTKVFAQEPNIPDSVQNINTNFHFQLTSVSQFKSSIHAPYSGAHSLNPNAERASTLTATIFWSEKLWKNAALYINPEVAGGGGISQAQGIAGFTNGEAFRVGQPAPAFYLARLFVQQTISLSDKRISIGENTNEAYKTKPSKYIDLIFGKFSNADYFDKNSFSHDPRTQFLNWSLMSNGAWDYAANVRGYTVGGIIEYGTENFFWRTGLTLLPLQANGSDLNFEISKARSWITEIEKRFLINKRKTIIRLLAYHNTANMGNYNQAVLQSENPDITQTRANGRTKYGIGINAEQDLNNGIGLFARASWNDGKNETWAFTEIDRSVSLGMQFEGYRWKRPNDTFGVGAVLNGISKEHQSYLAAGGLGFIIGDGRLNYKNEFATEIYYKANLFSDTFFLSPNIQYVNNPGYNKDRGPAFLGAIRFHIQF